MSKDYKYRAAQPRSPSPKSQATGFLWFISGTLLGAFFIGMVWLKVNPNLLSGGTATNTSTNIGNAANTGGNVASVTNGAAPKNEANSKATDTSKGSDSAVPASQLKFEFADMLKNAKVTLPVHDANAPPIKPTQPPPALPPKPHPEPNAQDAKNNQDNAPATPADQPKSVTTEPAPKHPTTTGHDAAAKSRRSKTKNHPRHTDDDDTPKVAVTKPRVRRHSAEGENGHTDEVKHTEHKEKSRLAKTQRSKPLVLQLGAFNREEDARQLRARMALLGIETEIQHVKTKDNKIIQRLRTSPYSNQDDLEEARKTLNRHNVKNYTTQ